MFWMVGSFVLRLLKVEEGTCISFLVFPSYVLRCERLVWLVRRDRFREMGRNMVEDVVEDLYCLLDSGELCP